MSVHCVIFHLAITVVVCSGTIAVVVVFSRHVRSKIHTASMLCRINIANDVPQSIKSIEQAVIKCT